MPLKQFIRRLHGDVAIQTINSLTRLEKKFINSSNHLTFLMRCRDLNLVPNGLSLSSHFNSPAARSILHNASKLLVKERIRHHRKVKATTLNSITSHLDTLSSTLELETYSSLRAAQTKSNNILDNKTKTTHLKKLQQLNPKPADCTTTRLQKADYQRKTVVNLSDKPLNKEHISVLSRGLKFVPTRPLRNHDDFIINVEKGLQQLAPGGKVDFLRHQIADILQKSKPQQPNITKPERQAITDLRKDKSITIVQADKGKAVVVLNTNDFNKMVSNILDDDTTYRKIKKDPTQKLQRQHKAHLKQLRDNYELSHELHHKLAVSHPQAPYARATVKIHKNPPKARLLVCSRDTVFYNTAQHLTKVLAPLGKTADSYISDSTDFCEKLKTVENPGKIVSYDVVDLFTSVPINETLHILRNRLDNLDSPLDTKLSTDSILQLITNSITSTYFTWGDELYEQIHGLPMGSPLSPILSEIYMTSFEHQALSSSLIKPTCWFRKVDDTFVILPQANDPSALLQHLNQQHPRIQFTFETESNSQLPFLDVLVTRTTDNTIQTSVYPHLSISFDIQAPR
ncbi:uncharacterized protein [Haliotis asinina]|uniref:uncharacterized protein n=1 Tax=Haliotis asinina TaxID=109174 RepID=UPI003532693D